VLEGIAVVVAVVAAYFAWRANHKSDEANEIARSALKLSEAEHDERHGSGRRAPD
jgi:hypothetical protein